MRLVYIFIGLLFLIQKNLFAGSKTLELRTGETRSIEIPTSSQIFVSRKGHITLTHDHGNHWLVSALRMGAVKITARLKNGDEQTTLINISPREPRRILSKDRLRGKDLSLDEICQDLDHDLVYAIKVSVELMDNSHRQSMGFDQSTRINLTGDHFDVSVGLASEPYKNEHQRQIIANPVVLSRACNDVQLRTGGEDEVTAMASDGRASTTWKTHGLDLKLKIIPLKEGLLKVPFYVGLRTPSKGQGSYGLTDVQSTISTRLTEESLAAVINLSSTISFEKSQFWITELPILGPWFRHRDNTAANSTLLVWLKINQRSVSAETP